MHCALEVSGCTVSFYLSYVLPDAPCRCIGTVTCGLQNMPDFDATFFPSEKLRWYFLPLFSSPAGAYASAAADIMAHCHYSWTSVQLRGVHSVCSVWHHLVAQSRSAYSTYMVVGVPGPGYLQRSNKCTCIKTGGGGDRVPVLYRAAWLFIL